MNITVKENKYNFDLNKLLTIGYRANNEKRNFLFISKCLGKHLIVKPEVCRLVGFALAHETYENISPIPIDKVRDLIEYPYTSMKEECDAIYKNIINTHSINESVIVLGFAETATGLGMAVASAIKNSHYITTTRELIEDTKSCFDFEETHSHATNHKCYLKEISKLDSDRIILVDDEITTGNTMLNLIKSLETNLNYKKRKYTILSILDWRNQSQLDKFEEFKNTYNIDIEVKSIISGTFENNNHTVFESNDGEEITERLVPTYLNVFKRETHTLTKHQEKDYIDVTGRFGVSQDEIAKIEHKASAIYDLLITKNPTLLNQKVLVLGHGENIYIPSRIASKFPNAEYKTTSRSPIYISNENNYPIKEKHHFNFEDTKYFFYDKSFIENHYDIVILFTEDMLDIKLCKNQITYIL